MSKVITKQIEGKRATHTIHIHDEELTDSLYNTIGETIDSTWTPESGAMLKTAGAATGWLTKKIKKHGWPDATTWHIYPNYCGLNRVPDYACYLIKERKVA